MQIGEIACQETVHSEPHFPPGAVTA